MNGSLREKLDIRIVPRTGGFRHDGTGFYLFSALGILPLVFYNGYFDITETKTLFFVCISAVFLLIRLVGWTQADPALPGPWDKWAAKAAFPAAFCLISLMASLGSGFFRDSFLGTAGRYQGTGMFILYALVYCAFPKGNKREVPIVFPLCFGILVSSALAVADHFGLDPLGLSVPLGEFDRNRYISTLGNINFAGAYLCLTVPVTARYLLSAEGWTMRSALLGSAFAAGLCAAMACRSECAVLGIGAAVILMPFTAGKDQRAFRRWGLLLTGIIAIMQLYGLIVHSSGFWLSSITDILLSPVISAGIAVFGAAWYLVAGKLRGKEKKVLVCYGGFLSVSVLTAVVLLYLLNTRWSEYSLGAAGAWLRFSDGWGTDRILIWRHCLSFYWEFPMWDKLFGGGCGILARLDVYNRIFPDAVLDAAHNEYLQILLNWGALGLAAYIGWIVTSIVGAFRKGSLLSMAVICGLAGYAIQACVNIAQAPGIMQFFVLLAIAGTSAHGRSGEDVEGISKFLYYLRLTTALFVVKYIRCDETSCIFPACREREEL